MTDEQIINKIAEVWLECGGDAEGFSYVMYKIQQKIKEKENE